MQKTMIFNADLCQRSKSTAIHVGLLFYQIILLASDRNNIAKEYVLCDYNRLCLCSFFSSSFDLCLLEVSLNMASFTIKPFFSLSS